MLVNNLGTNTRNEFLELLGDKANEGIVLYGGDIPYVDKERKKGCAYYFSQWIEEERKLYELLYIKGKLESRIETTDEDRVNEILELMLDNVKEFGLYEEE